MESSIRERSYGGKKEEGFYYALIKRMLFYSIMNGILGYIIYSTAAHIRAILARPLTASTEAAYVSSFIVSFVTILLDVGSIRTRYASLVNEREWQKKALSALAFSFTLHKILSVFSPNWGYGSLQVTLGILSALFITKFPEAIRATFGRMSHRMSYSVSLFFFLVLGSLSYYVTGLSSNQSLYMEIPKDVFMVAAGVILSLASLLVLSMFGHSPAKSKEDGEKILNLFSMAVVLFLVSPAFVSLKEPKYMGYEFTVLFCMAYRYYGGKGAPEDKKKWDIPLWSALKVALVVLIPYGLKTGQLLYGKLMSEDG
jgi:hypothetical protein